MPRVAVIQQAPAFLDRARTIAQAADAVREAARGGAAVVAPGGKLVAGPMTRELGILYADMDPALIASARRSLDVVGHYARPDLFQLRTNAAALKPAELIGP